MESLFVALVLVTAGILALEFRVSTAITEIIAGVLLGLFVDVSPMNWLEFLAHFGMLGLMFMAGFDVDPLLLRKRLLATSFIGTASFLVPFLGVYLISQWLVGLNPRVAALFAIGLSTTSLALVFGFLSERGLLSEATGQTILGAAMVVDVLSMIGVALLLGKLGWATTIFVVSAVPAFWSLPRFGKWIFSRYGGNAIEFELRFLLLVLVGLAFLAENAGIHAAVVGFAAGVIMSEVIQHHQALEEKLRGIVFSFLAPVFFLSAGTQLDIRGLDLSTVGMTLLFCTLAIALKFIGTALGALLFTPSLKYILGVLFNYRLTFGIIAANIGFEQGVFDQRLFSVILLTILSSALLPVFLLRHTPREALR